MNATPESQQHRLSDHAGDIGLPPDLCARPVAPADMAAAERLLSSHDEHIPQRRFVTGLAFAFLAVVEDLIAQLPPDVPAARALTHCPLEELDGAGRRRNSLFIQGPQHRISLRRYYNAFQQVVWDRLFRYDYPNCPAHATQAWPQHRDLLDGLLAATPGTRHAFAQGLWERVMALPEFEGRTGHAITPRPFAVALSELPNTQRGEPPGALLQGLGFAYYRADAPNVTLETGKVKAGGARTGRAGDVDGWSGGALVLSIEVKDADITAANVADVSSWLANLARWPDATAIVLARSFAEEACQWLAERRVLTLDRERMTSNVELWDVNKQHMAMRELHYFLSRVQQNSALLDRVREFCEERDLPFD